MTPQELFAAFPTFADIPLNIANQRTIRILRTVAEGKPRNLLLHGKPGSGKTSLAYLLARWSNQSQGNATVEPDFYDCSGGLNLAILRKPQTSWAACQGLGTEWLILDDIEGITPHRQKALRGIMKAYPFPRHFILTTNDLTKADQAVLDRCEHLEIVAPRPDEYLPYARKRLSAGGVHSAEEVVLTYLQSTMKNSLRTAERKIDDVIAELERP